MFARRRCLEPAIRPLVSAAMPIGSSDRLGRAGCRRGNDLWFSELHAARLACPNPPFLSPVARVSKTMMGERRETVLSVATAGGGPLVPWFVAARKAASSCRAKLSSLCWVCTVPEVRPRCVVSPALSAAAITSMICRAAFASAPRLGARWRPLPSRPSRGTASFPHPASSTRKRDQPSHSRSTVWTAGGRLPRQRGACRAAAAEPDEEYEACFVPLITVDNKAFPEFTKLHLEVRAPLPPRPAVLAPSHGLPTWC